MNNSGYIQYGNCDTGDCNLIVGNKKGLVRLRNAIDRAILTGEFIEELDELDGIKCYEDNFFKNKSEIKDFIEPSISLSRNFFALLIHIFWGSIIVTGLYHTLNKILN